MIKCVSPVRLENRTSFKQKPKYSFARDFINSTGLFVQEDLLKVQAIQKNYSQNSLPDIRAMFQKSIDSTLRLIQDFFTDTRFIGSLLIYNNEQPPTAKLLKMIKQMRLKQHALSALLINATPREIAFPKIEKVFNINQNIKNLPISTKENLLEHPINIAQNIVGTINKPINKLNADLYKHKDAGTLLKIKYDIVKKVSAFIKEKGSNKNFKYKKEELTELRKLIVHYRRINDILSQNNIHTENIESLIFHPMFPQNIKVGDELPNSDTVINVLKINDKIDNKKVDAIMTFANTNSGYRLKLYRQDKDMFDKLSNISKLYRQYIQTRNFEKLNQLNIACKKHIDNTEIAEIFFQEKSKEEMRRILAEPNLISREKIEELLVDNEQFIFTRNLKNYNVNRYYNVSFPLISSLRWVIDNNNFSDVFINAFAYNNVKHSPAALYIRAGCEPISHTKDEILELLKKEDKAVEQPILFVYHPRKSN